jgi:hypothetical protein
MELSLHKRLKGEGIRLLQADDSETVRAQLFGQRIQ